MRDDIRYLKTVDGVQIRFPKPVYVPGTEQGTRIGLTDTEALLLHYRLGQYLRREAASAEPEPSMFATRNAVEIPQGEPRLVGVKVIKNPWGEYPNSNLKPETD